MHNTCSIIISYNSNEAKLLMLAKTLSKISFVLIFDNSHNLNYRIFKSLDSVEIIDLNENLGTLKAYNYALFYKQQYKYFWLWDQDTTITENTCIDFYNRSINLFETNRNIVVTTFYDKKNFISPFNKKNILIKASTSLFFRDRLMNLKENYFDENLFMDYGDWLLSQLIYENGLEIKQIRIDNYTHEFGEVENTIIGAYARSSENRIYMQALNSVYIFRKIGFFNFLSFLLLCRIILLPLKNLLFKNSCKRTKIFLLGLIDGIKGKKSNEFIHKQ